MINYTTNQRRSTRWTGSNWMEEVLAASGVEVDNTNLLAISGANVQEVLEAADNVINGINYSTASGIVTIDDVTNVSGVVGGTIGGLDVITLPSGSSNSILRFSFSVGAQPVDPVNLRVIYSPRQSGTGFFKANLAYNLFDQTDALGSSSFAYSGTQTVSVAPSDFEKMKLLSIQLPLVNFSSGSAPFVVSAQLTRDASVSGNFAGDISIVSMYADNIPGGVMGNTAGYIGGNLNVTGDLTVDGFAIFQGGTAPATITGTGISGSLVIADDFLYCAVAANSWKRINLSQF